LDADELTLDGDCLGRRAVLLSQDGLQPLL
jgi:hypothetical protein